MSKWWEENLFNSTQRIIITIALCSFFTIFPENAVHIYIPLLLLLSLLLDFRTFSVIISFVVAPLKAVNHSCPSPPLHYHYHRNWSVRNNKKVNSNEHSSINGVWYKGAVWGRGEQKLAVFIIQNNWHNSDRPPSPICMCHKWTKNCIFPLFDSGPSGYPRNGWRTKCMHQDQLSRVESGQKIFWLFVIAFLAPKWCRHLSTHAMPNFSTV